MLYSSVMKNTTYKFAFASSGIVPLRKTDSDTAEMVSQVLLGETVHILESVERWHRVRSDFDGYEGWVSVAQVTPIDEQTYIAWFNHPERVRSPYFTYRVSRGNSMLLVPTGAPIINTGYEIELPNGPWEIEGRTEKMKEHALMDTATKLLGVPYLWGGRTDSGIDCSGFVQLVYSLHRYNLPRDASQQFEFAPRIKGGLESAKYGDLVYFSSNGKNITHIGFYFGDGNLLHASGNVQINCIDPEKRTTSTYVFSERLSQTIVGVQSSAAVKAAASQQPVGAL